MKILITGGHVTPALAVIDELRKHKNIEIVFVGKKYALDFEKTLSFEYQSIKNLGLKFIELKTGRLTRILSWRSIINFLRFPFGFYHASQILNKEKPDIIISFGGYLALPIAVVGRLVKIPIFIHEQTLIPGLTNRAISLFAKKVFVSFPETKKYFKKSKTILTGNPLRVSIFQTIKKVYAISQHNKKIIYITGGSLGAHSLNVLIERILNRLLDKFVIIHQTGDTEEYQDFDRLSKIKNKHYFVRRHFYDTEIGFIYSLADLIICRAGANTTFELIALRKPAVLIPLPWSASGEQKAQAKFLKANGVAEILYQNNGKGNNRDDPSGRLYKLIINMADNLAKYQRNFIHLEDYYKENAAQKIVNYILAKD